VADGNKLELTMTHLGKEQKQTVTITKLTGEELVGVDAKNKEQQFTRVKPN
jgi:uncharacterized protein (TIGR03066 family)